ncbi:MAG TPA: phosphotransferase [Candidatus Limnocylindrales bacterium]
MRRLSHGYTNDTRGDGAAVVKRYQGPDWAARRMREHAVLDRLSGRLPVPTVLGGDEDSLRMGFVAGVHGQDLIEAGHAVPVLRACGRMLRRIHGIDPEPGPALVHGDYGPNNVLLDPATFEVTAVLDWEWAHAGNPVRDLAWCEWIVRMHHHEHVDALDALDGFFDGYGDRPAWALRHEAMLAQCRSLLGLCQRWTTEAADLWRHRLDITAAWTEAAR